MQFLFIDDTAQINIRAKQFFCLIGLSVGSGKLIEFENDLLAISRENSIDNLKDLRSMRFTHAQKLVITECICNALVAAQAKALAIVLGRQALRNHKKDESLYVGALTFLLERFFISLNKPGKEDSGMMVMDTVDTPEMGNKIRKKFFDFVTTQEQAYAWTSHGLYCKRICPSLMLVDDKNSPAIQVADLIAVSLKSALNSCIANTGMYNIESLCNYDSYLSKYWNFFVRSHTGSVTGWGIKYWE